MLLHLTDYLLRSIIAQLYPRDFWSLSLVNRRLNALAQPRLYSNIILGSHKTEEDIITEMDSLTRCAIRSGEAPWPKVMDDEQRVQVLLTTLLTRPDLAQQVQRLQLGSPDRPGKLHSDAFIGLLQCCAKLEALTIQQDLPTKQLVCIQTTVARSRISKLEMQLDRWSDLQYVPRMTLRSLTLSNSGFWYPFDEPAPPAELRVEANHITLRNLGEPYFSGNSVSTLCTILAAPRRLTIDECHFSPDSIADLLRHCKPRLEKLDVFFGIDRWAMESPDKPEFEADHVRRLRTNDLARMLPHLRFPSLESLVISGWACADPSAVITVVSGITERRSHNLCDIRILDPRAEEDAIPDFPAFESAFKELENLCAVNKIQLSTTTVLETYKELALEESRIMLAIQECWEQDSVHSAIWNKDLVTATPYGLFDEDEGEAEQAIAGSSS
ncbi:hypothetical protein EMMF5_005783 [Cystobasidiomycetes sp. EMM_F5]